MGVSFLDTLSKLITILKKASPDFEFMSNHKSGLMTHIAYSEVMNQIIAIKFPNRKDYISPGTALKYLQGTQKVIFDLFGNDYIRK